MYGCCCRSYVWVYEVVEAVAACRAIEHKPFEPVFAEQWREALEIVIAQLVDGDAHHEARCLRHVLCLAFGQGKHCESCDEQQLHAVVSDLQFVLRV